MREPKEIIASGELELYVLGKLTESEKEEILSAAKIYPEVANEIARIEADFEEMDQKLAITPSFSGKKEALNALSWKSNQQAFSNMDEIRNKLKFWRTLAAASLTLAIISAFGTWYFFNMYKESNIRLQAINETNQILAQEVKFSQSENSSLSLALDVANNPAFQKITIEGLELKPEAQLSVWLNREEETSFVFIRSLSDLPSDLDYQLWALVDGNPVDLGVISIGDTNLARINYVPGAQAFAVTIEPKGGRPTPTLEKLCAIGYVS